MRALRLLAIAGIAATALNATAHTIRVPQDAPTIQAGLDSLLDGDTVLVAMGTYAEALSAPPLNFVLRGVATPDSGEYGRPVIDPTPLLGSDSLTCLTLPEGSHPVIEDLVFRNGLAMYPHLYNDGGVTSRATDPVFRRVVMDSVIYALTHSSSDPASVVTLESCEFLHIFQSGVQIQDGALHATECLFSQNQANLLGCRTGSRIFNCQFNALQSPGDNALFINGEDIQVSHCIFTASVPMLSRSLVVRDGELDFGTGIQITDNVFASIEGQHAPLLVHFDYPHYFLAEISDNTFIGIQTIYPGLSGAIEFEEAMSVDPGLLSILTNNLFVDCRGPFNASNAVNLCVSADLVANRFVGPDAGNQPAVLIPRDSASSSTVFMRDNRFYDTGTAIANLDEAWVSADSNWWGDSTGPYHAALNPAGQGDTIVGNVDFDPWYPDTSFLSVPGLGKPLPEAFVLEAYPNPFNNVITFRLTPPEAMIIRVELFDILGRRVREIWSGPLAFQKQITFDGTDLASGIYFARVWQPIGNRPLALSKLVLMK